MNYTIQFTEEEFDQLVGDLYYYFRYLKFNLDHSLELDILDEDEKQYFTTQLERVVKLQSKLENIRNKADESNPLYILAQQSLTSRKEVEINE